MIRSLCLASLLSALGAASLVGQAGPSAGGPAPSASLRVRAESWNWFGAEEAGEYAFLGATLRAGLADQGARFGWQVELAAPLLVGLPDDATAPAPAGQLGLGPAYFAANDGEETVGGAFLKQAYIRLGAAPGRAGHGVRVGRLEFVDGGEAVPADATLAAVKRDRVAHRLIGNFGWSHVGRSLDGAHYAYGAPWGTVVGLAARPTQGVFDVNGWGELDVGVAYGSVTLPRVDERTPGEARLFALQYVDYRRGDGLVKVDNRALALRRADRGDVAVSTLGGHYLRGLATPAGVVDVLLWGAVQAGSWGAQDHRAWSAAAEAGIQPPVAVALRPWLRLGWSRGSGDADPVDDTHATFFQVLPTPRIYARLPFYNLMNTQEVFGSLIVRPGGRVALRSDLRSLRLSSRDDLWYAGGGAFEPETFGFAGRTGGGGESLATLLDLSAELRVNPRVTVTGYAGWARGGEVVESIYGSGGDARLGYLEVEIRPLP